MIIPVLQVVYDRVKEKQEEKQKVEGFDSGEDAFFLISYLINFIIMATALYLCFRRNSPEINFGAVIVAFCCPICYIVYALAVPVT